MQFHPFDLVFPIGLSLAAIALCIWAAVKAEQTGAKVASVLCGLLFASAIPGWYYFRYSETKADYVTDLGLRVHQGEKNRCEEKDLTEWSDWLINFWKEHFDAGCAGKAFEDWYVHCIDQERLKLASGWVTGYTTDTLMVISYDPNEPRRPERSFKHEMSHRILDKCGMPWAGSEQAGGPHHDYFAKVKLGY
jgi:hypothetical protein